jgi:hypothetical protein
MAYLIVVVLSLLVGAGVYSATLRAGGEGPAAVGFDGPLDVPGDGEGEAIGLEGPGPGYTYLRVGTGGPSWRDRLQGFVGLMVLLVVGATALAFGIYQLGHLVNVTIERFLQK